MGSVAFSDVIVLKSQTSKLRKWCDFHKNMWRLASFPGSLPLRIFTRVQEFQRVTFEPARSKVTRWNSCIYAREYTQGERAWERGYVETISLTYMFGQGYIPAGRI